MIEIEIWLIINSVRQWLLVTIGFTPLQKARKYCWWFYESIKDATQFHSHGLNQTVSEMSRGLVRGTDKGGKLYNYAFKPEMTIAACEIRRIVCTRKVDMNNIIKTTTAAGL